MPCRKVGVAVEKQQDRRSREPVAGFLEPQVERDRDAAHVADLEIEDNEIGILELHGVAHFLAARDFDDPLLGTDECRPHLIADPARVGGNEDRGAHEPVNLHPDARFPR